MLGPSLRFQQTMTIAVVLTDISNPFWTTVTRGVEDIAQASGYSTILCNTDESIEKQDQYLHMLLRRRIDGILLVPASSDPEPIWLIQKQGTPVVVLDRRVSKTDVDSVRSNSEEGAYQLGRHLLSLGHQCFTILAGPNRVSTSVDRVNGFCRAIDEARVSPCEPLVLWGDYSQESGYQLAKQALNMTPRSTAIFAANNFIAMGALRALKEQNWRVPEDIALVTFDDIPFPFSIEPFLTVAAQPAREIGKQAVRLLIQRIKGESREPIQEVLLPVEVIIRDSSGGQIEPKR
jgi:LacI family transcriptional regulator